LSLLPLNRQEQPLQKSDGVAQKNG
jgi:hypothetical protein